MDFLESHPEHSLCFHANRITFKNGKAKEYSPYNKDKEMCPMKDLILSGGGFMATNSMLYVRTQGENMPAWRKMSPVGDAPLMLVLAERGKVGYLNDIMSCYRFGTGGSWTQKQRNSRVMRKDTFQKGLRVWKEFDKWTDNKYHKYVRMKIVKNYIHYLGKEILYLFSRI